MKNTKSLGDRMKAYEQVSHYSLSPNVPVIIRVDGRAFHSYAKSFEKPFDSRLIAAMEHATIATAAQMQGFKIAYTQSDEATFCLTDYDTINTQGWFDYDLAKLVSISASAFTIYFNGLMRAAGAPKPAMFDARAFSVPANEVANMFLWRAKDWKRNSINMFARSYFSHTALKGKNQDEVLELLKSINVDWNCLSFQKRYGTFIKAPKFASMYNVEPVYSEIAELVDPLLEYSY